MYRIGVIKKAGARERKIARSSLKTTIIYCTCQVIQPAKTPMWWPLLLPTFSIPSPLPCVLRRDSLQQHKAVRRAHHHFDLLGSMSPNFYPRLSSAHMVMKVFLPVGGHLGKALHFTNKKLTFTPQTFPYIKSIYKKSFHLLSHLF